jgi:hypothetical protein
MARIVIENDNGEVYSTFRIRPQVGWGAQLEDKLESIIRDLQEVLKLEVANK